MSVANNGKIFTGLVIIFLHKLINNYNLFSISAPSEMVKSLSPLSILSSSSSVSSSSVLSSSPSINENSSLMQSCIKSTPENQEISLLVQPCIKSTLENKKNKAKNTIIQEVDEVDKSFMNLSSVMSQHFSGKQKMDEDDVFGSTIAYQLRRNRK